MSLVPLEPELLDHIVVEFGEHGQRAVDFLATARDLLELTPAPPRLAESIAYCLREAMKTIPASQTVGDHAPWRASSRAVAEARRRYELVRGVPGEDEAGALSAMLAAIDDLELVHSQDSIHERRLIAIMVNRTGALPVASGTAPVRDYQTLLHDLDSALHSDATVELARGLWDRCAAILRQLFLPPDMRHAELDRLASLEPESGEDVERLLPLIASPTHLLYFMRRISSPLWLELLTDIGVVDPPAENGPWPVFAAIDHLAPDHGPFLADWLGRLYLRHAHDATRCWFIARAAADTGFSGAPLVLQALGAHRTLPMFAALGVLMVTRVPPESEHVERFADILFNADVWEVASYIDPMIEAFTNGLEEGNAVPRLRLLAWKISSAHDDEGSLRSIAYDSRGSIADEQATWRDDRISVLLQGLVTAIRRTQRWIPLAELLEIADSLPTEVRGRMRALVLAESQGADTNLMIEELAAAIRERDPTGDDLALIDRVVSESSETDYSDVWAEALGPPPEVGELAEQIGAGQVEEKYFRALHWISALPEDLFASWRPATSVMAAAYGRPNREALRTREHPEVMTGRSPISLEELRGLAVDDATQRISEWRSDPSEWLVSARELARALQEVMKERAEEWVSAPLQAATSLRHPTYIHHYLLGVAEAIKRGVAVPVAELFDTIAFVHAHPWPAEPLGRSAFDYDQDWRGADQAAIEVIKALAEKDVGFDGHTSQAWAVLDTEVRDRSEASAVVSGARDVLDSAINRRCTRALDAVLSFVAHQFRLTGVAPPPALALLEESLHLEGSDGAEHRAIIVTRLGFLRHVAPDWVDSVADLLFGGSAPEGLDQITADLALKWGRPNRWFLESYPRLVRNAVSRDVEHALENLLLAMFWAVPGYSVEENFAFLRQTATRLSRAGEFLGRMLRQGEQDEAHVRAGLALWDATLGAGTAETLLGFGWLAEVDALEKSAWASRTRATLTVTGGKIDWAHKVAERAVGIGPSETTLEIMNSLVRGSSGDWDLRGNMELAGELLRSAGALSSSPEYQRLHTTLLERGGLE